MHQFSGWLLRLLRRIDLIIAVNTMIRKIFVLIKNNGSTFTVLYLKESLRITYHWMAGEPLRECGPGPFVSISKFGLPTLINPVFMGFIKGDKVCMQITLFLLSFFRLLEIPGILKLNTITDPSEFNKGVATEQATRALKEARIFGNQFWTAFQVPSIKKAWPFFAGTKTPSGLSAFLSIPTSLRAFTLSEEGRHIYASLLYINLKTGSYLVSIYLYFFYRFFTFYNRFYPFLQRKAIGYMMNPSKTKPWLVDKFFVGWQTKVYGKLALKHEAAGKIRVFAMVDPITQWTLKPFHIQLIKILSQFPWDGTKDQIGVARKFSKKYVGFPMYSFDISSATDRIPMEFYEAVLAPLWGDKIFQNWKSCLIDRSYMLRSRPKQRHEETVVEFLKYGAGQPMGALSSWASLAVIHHFIVALAASHVGFANQSFRDYIILGDDIVIANKEVAESYLEIMRDIGVEINLSKSLVSSVGVMEFAKRVWYNGEIFSAIPPRDAFLAFRHPVMLPNFIRGLARDVMMIPASHSIRFVIEHFGVRYDSYRNVLSLPKALIGSIVELIGVNSLYKNEYTPSLMICLSRSRLLDLERWFSCTAHHIRSDVFTYNLLNEGYYKHFDKENPAPLSWTRRFKATVNGSGIGISSLDSLILIFTGFLIEIRDIVLLKSERRRLLKDKALAEDSISYNKYALTENFDSVPIDPSPIMGRSFEVPFSGFGRDFKYFVYSLNPLDRSPLNKVSMDWTSTPSEIQRKVRDAYRGARSKAKLVRGLRRPYLQLPAV
jgi:hypothetical protein